MTKEELKQEAEESFEQYKVTDEDYVISPYSDDMGEKMLMFNYEYEAEETYLRLYTQGYLAGAEPREKRIAELEKENAELKEQINTKDILIKELQEQKVYWKESSFDWRHKFFKLDKVKRLIKKDKQLTKAKELLKQFLNAKNGEDTYKAEWEAEQFLNSEVEKCGQ